MSRRLPPETHDRVLRLWMQGFTYAAIAERTGVSQGSIANILHAARDRVPDLDELRRLHAVLREAHLSVVDVRRTAALHAALNDANLSTEDLRACIAFYRQVQGRPREVATAGLRLLALERTHGQPYDAFLTTYEAQLRHSAALDAQIRAQVDEQATRERALPHLADLEAVHRALVDAGLTIPQLHQFIQDARTARTAGFTPQLARQLGEGFTRAGYDPRTAAEVVVTLLTQHATLNAAVTEKQSALNVLTHQETVAQNRVQTLNDQMGDLQARQTTLRDLTVKQEDAYRARTTELDATYRARARTLQAQHAQAQAEATKQLRDEVATLQTDHATLTERVETLTQTEVAMAGDIAFTRALIAFLKDPTKLSKDEREFTLERLRTAIYADDVVPTLRDYSADTLNQVKSTVIALFDELVVPIETHQALQDTVDALRRTSQQVPQLQAQLDGNVAEQARKLFRSLQIRRCKNCETMYPILVGDPLHRYGRGDDISCPVCHHTLDQDLVGWEPFIKEVRRSRK